MRFESVTAHSFGPFSGRKLDLKPGMNVVWGLNESGKSTWHSALYVGLCGRPRRKGKQHHEEEEFESKHKPWDQDEWRVST
ncbi:MAG TPA: AAA family ATPase, partial [Blastocatellia bacterium]|nr:AAA family ATPase [Blastocatellia bacterium]